MLGLLFLCPAEVMFNALPDGVVGLVYADPPHCTGRIFRGTSGWHHSGVEVFSDRWSHDGKNISVSDLPSCVEDVVCFVSSIYDEGMDDYAAFMGRHIFEMKRVLDKRGSLFLHIGLGVFHIMRMVCDAIFGSHRCVNVIVWHRTGGGRPRKRFSHKYDLILWFSRTKQYRFFPDAVRVPYSPTSGYARSGIVAKTGKHYVPNPKGTIPDDVWRIPMVNPMSHERVGYPTQKPQRLLERIVLATTRKGDIVVDPFCGSGTSGVVAGRLGRPFIICDVNEYAVEVSAARLEEADIPFRLVRKDFEKAVEDFLEEHRHRRCENESAFL